MSAGQDENLAPEALGELLSRAGHDIRDPVNVVIGAIDELGRTLGAEQAGANAALFTMAQRGVRKLLRLADRYSVLSELKRRPELPVQAIDVKALVGAAIAEASYVYGRRAVELGQELEQVSGVASPRWMTAAVADAVMLALRLSQKRATVRLEKQGGLIRVMVTSDRGADALEGAWGAALAGADMSGESVLPIQLVTGVLAAHGGAARVERAGEGAIIALEWPAEAPRREDGA